MDYWISCAPSYNYNVFCCLRLTMHYCGAFRQATPPTLSRQLKPTQSQQVPQEEPTTPVK
ncbi:hypothetical protein BZZ01_11925 [Nostocales cyanobacterium HT-58-2]|nr:hypothetical protein BZZ01_11925 [Nostocales cyanobacterium HT-58-2]